MSRKLGTAINDNYDPGEMTIDSEVAFGNVGDDDFHSANLSRIGDLLNPLLGDPGVVVQTDTNEYVNRTITGSSNISVTSGNGVSANPTLDLSDIGTLDTGAFGSASYGIVMNMPNQKGRPSTLANIHLTPTRIPRSTNGSSVTLTTDDTDGFVEATAIATAVTCELPSYLTQPIPIGANVVLALTGAGSSMTVTAGAGATLVQTSVLFHSNQAIVFEKIDADRWMAVDNSAAPYVTGVHSTNLTGPWASPVATTINYTLIGNRVFLTFFQALDTATILSTIVISTVLPVFLRPSANRFFGTYIVNNSINALAVAQVGTGGAMTFYGDPRQNNFTAAGTAGLLSWGDASYQL